MKAKYFFNVFTIITILVLMMCQPFSAMGTIDYSYKLDKNLVDKIKDIDEKEKVDVSIWFNNIDYNTINDKLKEKIGDKVTTQIFGYVCDDYSEKKVTESFELEKKKSTAQLKKESQMIQVTIEEKRKLIKETCRKENYNIIKSLKNNLGSNDLLFVSKYLPNIEASLTRQQIIDIAKNKNIVNIFLKDNFNFATTCKAGVKSTNKKKAKLVISEKVAINNNNLIYSNLGISDLKKTYKLSGKGVKVGNIDWDAVHTEYDCFRKAYNEGRLNVIGNAISPYNHEDLTTAEIIGVVDGKYEGMAPNVEMYCISANDSSMPSNQIWKYKIELLLDEGVNIINASFSANGDGAGTYGQYYGVNYGDSAKWLDAMINTQNVTFVQSAHNFGIDQVISGGMAYNSIVVGNYDLNSNAMVNSSSYNSGSGTYKQYKPDIAAPGDVYVFFSENSDNNENSENAIMPVGGTSGAAPVVTSIAALLCEKYPYLKTNPLFLKTLILNSANYIGTENQQGGSNDFVAFDRQSGAGVINGARAVNCYASQSWSIGSAEPYMEGSFSTYFNKSYISHNTTATEFSKKKLRVTVCGTKLNYYMNSTNNIASQSAVDSFLPAFEITVYNSTHTHVYKSRFLYDNKCSLLFTPPSGGRYYITIKRIDNNYYSVPCCLFYTCS